MRPEPREIVRVVVAAAVAGGLTALGIPGPDGLEAQDAERGEQLYREWCAECHGATGEGDGPAADRMLPRPRDLVGARYQVRTTGSGQLPTDRDLMRVLEEGLPGTTMPGWPNLSRNERRDLVAYLKSLSRFFQGAEPEAMEFSDDPGGGGEMLEKGRRAWEALECWKCHGQEGRGDGESAPTLEDWRDLPVRAADLTQPWRFNGGSSVEDIHARFLTGLDGTPMPAYSDALQAEIVTEEELWGLAHYVRSLAPDRIPPRVRDVIRVLRAEAELPSGPEADAWQDVEPFWIPLAGQVIETPRNFAPSVAGVWVQGLHDGDEMALRLRWTDPSRSPDPRWTEWQEKIAATMDDDGVPIPTDPLPDRLVVQFPMEMPEGNERPYFLMGDRRNPVYLWRWNSRDGVSEARATGLGSEVALEGGSGLEGTATWEHGQWTLYMRRSLEPSGDEGLGFVDGRAIPVGFYAWDGNNGEDGKRAAVSSWFFVYLQEPASRSVYVAPVVAMLLTGGLGLFAAARARSRREGAA